MIKWIRLKHHYGRYKIIKSLVKGHGKKLLDIGCGSPCNDMKDGSFLRFLGYGEGCDIKDMDIKFKFKKASITSLPYKEGSFDVVTAIEVLEHVDKPTLALQNVSRVLKPGAVFVMSTPNNNLIFRAVWAFWERFVGKEWNHTHVSALQRDEWLSLLKKYFKVVKVVDYWGVNLIVKCVKA